MLNISLRSIPDGFYSDRSIPDCIDRLSARIEGGDSPDDSSPTHLRITGSIDGNRVSLRVASPPTPLMFARRFNGRFATLDDKTVLAGHYSVEPWIMTCIQAWLFMVIFTGLVFITDLVIGTQKLAHREAAIAVWGVFVFLFMFVIYISNRSVDADLR